MEYTINEVVCKIYLWESVPDRTIKTVEDSE
jgi:hypothetical protein